MGYYLSRQRCFSDNCLYVEIASGGKAKAGPDVLTARYENEHKNLVDPRDAVKMAESIFYKWDRDYADEKKRIRIVDQFQNLVFDCNSKGFEAARVWAEKVFSAMKKCANSTCGKAMGNRDPYEHNDLSSMVFCCELCLARRYRDAFGVELPPVKSSKKKGFTVK